METSQAARLDKLRPAHGSSVRIRKAQGADGRVWPRCVVHRMADWRLPINRARMCPAFPLRRAEMPKFQPDGWPTVIPKLFARDPENLVAFINHVFHARGEFHPGRPAEIRIGDSVVMVSDGGGLRDPVQAF